MSGYVEPYLCPQWRKMTEPEVEALVPKVGQIWHSPWKHAREPVRVLSLVALFAPLQTYSEFDDEDGSFWFIEDRTHALLWPLFVELRRTYGALFAFDMNHTCFAFEPDGRPPCLRWPMRLFPVGDSRLFITPEADQWLHLDWSSKRFTIYGSFVHERLDLTRLPCADHELTRE